MERNSTPGPVVHLELHTGDQVSACAFYSRLLGWSYVRVDTRAGSYLSTDLGRALGSGGVVECTTERPLWLPYAEVPDVSVTTARALRLGAELLLEPREGPAGWRSVVRSPTGGEVAFWQPKSPR
jgi:predicted enzyme related to lactoylglutathione lyase